MNCADVSILRKLASGDAQKPAIGGHLGQRNSWSRTLTESEDYPPAVNVLSEQKKQQVLALGRLGWSLRRIERTVHLRRETAATYLKAAGIPV
jgi:hypothetical protein